jgi:hypothetical protein
MALMFDRDGGESDFRTFVGELVEGGHLEGPALGIAKQVAEEGLEDLSEKQRRVFDTYVLSEDNVQDCCERCSIEIPWSEMYFAVHGLGDRMCSWCAHMAAKDN